MRIRPAESSDSSRVETLAHDSLRSSYALSPQQIETLVQHEFDTETMAGRLDDPNVKVLVAEHMAGGGNDIQGFVVVTGGEERTIRWIHVDPQARGFGIGTALLERVTESEGGRPVVAQIMANAVEGGEFLEQFGLESDRKEHMRVNGERFAVAVFTEGNGTHDGNVPTVPVPECVSVGGVDRHVDSGDRIPGRNAPFFSTHSGIRGSDPFGYFCSNCSSTDVAADGLDRVECGECGNLHVADQWDDSYL